MAENPLLQLRRHDQSVWLDDLTRNMLADGTLERLIRDDGLSGITSNPKIFQQAITAGDAYDAQIRELAERGLQPAQVFEEVAIRDVQQACDQLRGVYDETSGDDGFVSLEVSPHLARDTDATIEEAMRLWKQVDRANLLVKIPGTVEGVPAIRTCLERGVNVNITLLFALDRYRDVVEAWFEAMQTRLDGGEPLDVKSVASFFLSRIDAKVDPQLDAIGSRAQAVRGRAAVASAKLAYAIWKERFAPTAARWRALDEKGVMPQKLLWASTSTKDPNYPDTKYVEALIGPRTIDTMPRETLDAFRDHGEVAATLERGIDEQSAVMDQLAELGIDMDRVTDELVDEGIDKFVEPYDALLEALDEKMQALAGRE